jgi:hypothetical protein
MQGKMEGAESGTGGDQTRGRERCFYLFGFASFSSEVKDEERDSIGWVFLGVFRLLAQPLPHALSSFFFCSLDLEYWGLDRSFACWGLFSFSFLILRFSSCSILALLY